MAKIAKKKSARRLAEEAETRAALGASKIFRENLAADIKRTKKILANFPYPPGKKYRKKGKRYRQDVADAIKDGLALVKRMEKNEAKAKKKKKR